MENSDGDMKLPRGKATMKMFKLQEKALSEMVAHLLIRGFQHESGWSLSRSFSMFWSEASTGDSIMVEAESRFSWPIRITYIVSSNGIGSLTSTNPDEVLSFIDGIKKEVHEP